MERNRNNDHQFESIRALITQIHHGSLSSSNVFFHHSSDELSTNEMERSASDRSVNSLNTLPFLAVEKPRKRSMLDLSGLKIPMLTVTGPQSADSPDDAHLPRRFSFGNFRRHSHGSVRIVKQKT